MTRVLCGAALLIGVAAALSAQQRVPADDLEVLSLGPAVHVIAGAGGNIVVQIGEDGVVLVDTGTLAASDAVIRAVKALTPQPIRYIINTSADPDHVAGNETIAKAGQSLFGENIGPGGGFVSSVINNGGAASIVATENVLRRMSAPSEGRPPYPGTAWPTETFFRERKALYLNGEAIEVIAQPAAHTDGDAVVQFRRSDVVVTGDIFDMTRFPDIDVDKGGSIQGEIDALNRFIVLVIPSVSLPWKHGGTQVVPGHGRLAAQGDIVEYRDMVTIVRDRIAALIKQNMTLDQVQAATPTKGWTARYDRESAARFTAAVYRSLRTTAGQP